MKHYQDFVFNKSGSVESIGSTHSTFVMAEIKNLHNISFWEDALAGLHIDEHVCIFKR